MLTSCIKMSCLHRKKFPPVQTVHVRKSVQGLNANKPKII